MSTIKIEDVAYVRFSAPDLDEMRAFLTEFGLRPLPLQGDTLYARGVEGAPFVHATTLGPPAFVALGLRAASLADLQRLARAEGALIEDHDAPGGGKVVRLVDPDGYKVEVVANQKRVETVAIEAEPPRNSARMRARVRAPLRVAQGPARVMRIGHAVLAVTDFRRSEAWYKSRFGFITSDEIEAEPGVAIGAFMRCDRGNTPTDHHSLFLAQLPTAPEFMHAAFEVADLDDLMRGHSYLKQAKRTPAWGIGRHILGSHIFDYWRDPWGHELEHCTDGDLFTAADATHKATMQDLLGVQWGPQHPMMANAQGEQP